MFTAYVIVTMLATAFNAYAAYVDFARAEWVIANMTRYGIPRSWLFSLGALKALGAVGLLIGIRVPSIGIAASLGPDGTATAGPSGYIVLAHWDTDHWPYKLKRVERFKVGEDGVEPGKTYRLNKAGKPVAA